MKVEDLRRDLRQQSTLLRKNPTAIAAADMITLLLSPPPWLVEAVARGLCWEANGRDSDCSKACLSANACRGGLTNADARRATAAIAAVVRALGDER